VIVDIYLGYTWVISSSSRVKPNTVKNFTTEVQHQHNATILTIRSDNDTEFKNYTLNEFLSDEGIRYQYSTTYTPQQNGVVERNNQTLLDKCRPNDG
jgi:transposase InsO family protein